MSDEVITQAESAAQEDETKQAAASAAAESQETQIEQPDGESSEQPRGLQRRMNELTKRAHLAQAEAEFWRKKALGEGGAASAEKPKGKPNPAEFETTEQYLDARDEWIRQETLRETEERIKKAEQNYVQRTEQESVATVWSEAEASVKQAHADYEDVTASAIETLQASEGPAKTAIAHAVQYSEIGPELLYYLGQHPDEVQDLAELHPTQAALALGRLEARLLKETEGEGEKPSLPQTRAPKPATPLRKPSPGAKPSPDDPESDKAMSDEEWLRARRKQVRERQSR